MLDQVKEARAASDEVFGSKSVASFEFRRLELAYMLASSLPLLRKHVYDAIENFSEVFNGIKDEYQTQELSELTPINPVSLKNANLYQEIFEKNREYFIQGINRLAEPLLQYPYIITEGYELISSTVPSAPEETILKRSVLNGRIVHPILAAKHEFKVICAGEYSYITTKDGDKVLVFTTCSGHYLPKHITPPELIASLRKSLDEMESIPMLVFTNHGWLANDFFKSFLKDKYED